MSYSTTIGRFANNWTKYMSLSYILLAYIITLIISILIPTTFGENCNNPIVVAAIADVIGTICIWIAGIIVNNSSLYDPYWSVIPPVIVLYWAYDAKYVQELNVPIARIILVIISVSIWAIRLTTNWMTDFSNLSHEDWRYVNIRGAFKSKGLPKFVYWVVGSFLGIMMFPTVLVFAGVYPAYYAVSSDIASENVSDVNVFDYLSTAICVTAATIQYISDKQMRDFRKVNTDPQKCMVSGLWKFSRHPNYFGEISFWWGMFFHALAASLTFYYTIVGAILMTGLFVFISVPLMEKRSLKRRPNFKQVMNTTSMLLLLPSKAPKSDTMDVSKNDTPNE